MSGRSREQMREFILTQLGEHPEGLTTEELAKQYGSFGRNERACFINELMGLRVHYHITVDNARPPLTAGNYLVNKYTPSQWLEWARERQTSARAGQT